VQIIAQHHPGYTNNLMVPLKLDYELLPSVSKKFGLTVADEMLTEQEESKIMGTAWRHRNEATDFSGQPIFATRPPAEPKLPPLRFPGDDGPEASAGQEEEQEEQYEVDKIYAPPKDAYKYWFLTKENAIITIEQYAAEKTGSEPSKDAKSCGWRRASKGGVTTANAHATMSPTTHCSWEKARGMERRLGQTRGRGARGPDVT
jgi:hypothetical protein